MPGLASSFFYRSRPSTETAFLEPGPLDTRAIPFAIPALLSEHSAGYFPFPESILHAPRRPAGFAFLLLPDGSRHFVTLKPRNGAPLTSSLLLPIIEPIGARLRRPNPVSNYLEKRSEPDVAIMFLSGGFLLFVFLSSALRRSMPPRSPYALPPAPGKPRKFPTPPLLPSLTRAPF